MFFSTWENSKICPSSDTIKVDWIGNPTKDFWRSWYGFTIGDLYFLDSRTTITRVVYMSSSFWLLEVGSVPPRQARQPRTGPCLNFGFLYALIRNNQIKIGIEYWTLPGSNSPWRPCRLRDYLKLRKKKFAELSNVYQS